VLLDHVSVCCEVEAALDSSWNALFVGSCKVNVASVFFVRSMAGLLLVATAGLMVQNLFDLQVETCMSFRTLLTLCASIVLSILLSPPK
jgi:hypothetical protein